jgi:hypothetical protein
MNENIPEDNGEGGFKLYLILKILKIMLCSAKRLAALKTIITTQFQISQDLLRRNKCHILSAKGHLQLRVRLILS